MPRQGRELEKLIATLENLLGDTNIEVKSPDYVVGVNSGSRREIDVSLRTNVGSSEILVILETRDRNETDDVRWIEQLATKRKDVLASKVVAVSSSGFTEGARNTAQRLGIDLRSIDEITLESVATWFQLRGIQVYERHGILNHVILRVDNLNLETFQDALKDLSFKNINLIHAGTGAKFTIVQAWQDVMNQMPDMFDDIEPGGEKKQKIIHVYYEKPDARFMVNTDAGDIHLVQIIYQAVLSVELKTYPVSESKVLQYSKSDGGKISQTVKFEVNLRGNDVDISFHKMVHKSDIVLSIQPSKKSSNSNKQ